MKTRRKSLQAKNDSFNYSSALLTQGVEFLKLALKIYSITLVSLMKIQREMPREQDLVYPYEKNIIEHMGGSVNVKSTLGIGTSFIFNIKTKCIVMPVKIK